MDSTIVNEAITELYASKLYAQIRRHMSTKPFMAVIGKSRSETSHSAFLNWLFSAKELQNSVSTPLLSFLRLLALHSRNNSTLMDSTLCNQILINDINITDIKSVTEEYVDSGPNTGRVDIVIRAKVCFMGMQKTLRIVIENKIDSREGNNQCRKYYNHYKANEKVDYPLYVYLAPRMPSKLSSNHFIKITYQGILDKVILPLLHDQSVLPYNSINYIKMFVHNITSINNNSKIQIAMDHELQKLLKDFYVNNEDLILAAIDAGAPYEIKSQVNAVRKSRDYSTFELVYFLNNQKETVSIKAKSRVAKAFVETYCKIHPTATLSDLQKILDPVKKGVIFASTDTSKPRSESIDGHDDWLIETGIWGANSNYFKMLKNVISAEKMTLVDSSQKSKKQSSKKNEGSASK